MEVTRVEDPDLISRLGQSATFGERSEGLHVSQIYQRLMMRLEPKKYGKPIDADALRRMEIGILFENVLEQGLREKYVTQRVGEVLSDPILSTDGQRMVRIAMSPDGVNPTLVAGEEYKATFKSCSKGLLDDDGAPLIKFLAWFVQMMSYGYWLQLNDWLLRVLFIAGDYMRPILPQFHTYRIRFSDEEMENNWAMLIRIAREEGLL